MRPTLSFALAAFLLASAPATAHPGPPLPAAKAFLASLEAAERDAILFPFEARERLSFRWTPGRRPGLPLSDLSPESLERLRHLLTTVLSARGAVTLDAILATEAALGVIESRPGHRNPELYYTSLYGTPGDGFWGLRFEGHHLSVNITFSGGEAVSGTPLVLGANPETIPDGADAGLRALAPQVDLAWELYAALSPAQQALARDRGPGYGGFLTRAGSLRAPERPQSGIAWSDLDPAQRTLLRDLAISYIATLNADLSRAAIATLVDAEAAELRFFWQGAAARGGSYYYRISGARLFIEHDAMSGGSHIHAILRDREGDWAGQR